MAEYHELANRPIQFSKLFHYQKTGMDWRKIANSLPTNSPEKRASIKAELESETRT